MSVQANAPAATAQLSSAHSRLLHDASFQFGFAPPLKPPPPPDWLMALAKLLTAAGPVLKYVFWIGLGGGLLLVLALLVREFVLFRPADKRGRGRVMARESWRPSAAQAKALLQDADELAREGRFAEAAHALLFRSIEDIEGRRPRLIGPSLTSRDIAELGELPPAARPAFALIARHVERSLFGGQSLDASGFAECRRAYETFAFPGVWEGGRP